MAALSDLLLLSLLSVIWAEIGTRIVAEVESAPDGRVPVAIRHHKYFIIISIVIMVIATFIIITSFTFIHPFVTSLPDSVHSVSIPDDWI